MTDSSPSTSTPAGMNRYGAMAWEHWERHRPDQLAAIPDPTSYFRELGEFVESEVTAETTLRLNPTEATDPTRVAQVRRDVEEEILTAHVWLPSESEGPTDTETDPDLVEVIDLPVDSPTISDWKRSSPPNPNQPPRPRR